MNTEIEAWHFLPSDRRLMYEPHTFVYPGVTLKTEQPPVLCECGFHASRRLIDALYYAPGPMLCRVKIGGKIIEDYDKLVGTERTVLWMANADEMLFQFAQFQALSIIDKWDAPEVVKQFLKTGNPLLRSAAWSAASSAIESTAWSAAWNAARSAARSAARITAWSAADSAAWSAAWSAAESAASSAIKSAAWSAAWNAARSAASSAAKNAANEQLERMAWMLCGPETAQFPIA